MFERKNGATNFRLFQQKHRYSGAARADDLGKRARTVAERQFNIALQVSQVERLYLHLISELAACSI